MAEPTSTATGILAVAAGAGLATLVPGVDGNALIGAFAGAAMVALSSKEPRVLARLAYALISLVVGYLTAPDITHLTPIRESGVAAFLAAATAVAVVQIGIDKLRAFDIASIWRRGS
ncbi:putative holin [Pigmentiphaga kullae]|uniref:Putative phage holin n=1 Tax=Pigmentiphaga kullae TaxID=151784 RepID=A0A4Q7NCB6_9BURK|nr:putative holin [Pigmentiphaga kullae]RZS80662.1 putative phage holin [Pigmentiphaga kullae]